MPSKKDRRAKAAEDFLTGLDETRSETQSNEMFDLNARPSRDIAEGMTNNIFGGTPGPSAAELEQEVEELHKQLVEQRNKFVVTRTGIEISDDATLEDVLGKLEEVVAVETAIHWAYGDLLAYGEDRQWGTFYDRAQQITGKSYQTLANYAWVARSIHFSLRGEKLSYGHYKLIAKFPPKEQTRWINRVHDENLSVRQLAAAIEGESLPAPLPSWRKPLEKMRTTYEQQWDQLDSQQRRAIYEELRLMVQQLEERGLD
jgi:hypothetical protein